MERLYRDLHMKPELSMQEHRTAGIVARHLSDVGYEVTEGVGYTGVVGLLLNGAGPVVMLFGGHSREGIPESRYSRGDFNWEVGTKE